MAQRVRLWPWYVCCWQCVTRHSVVDFGWWDGGSSSQSIFHEFEMLVVHAKQPQRRQNWGKTLFNYISSFSPVLSPPVESLPRVRVRIHFTYTAGACNKCYRTYNFHVVTFMMKLKTFTRAKREEIKILFRCDNKNTVLQDNIHDVSRFFFVPHVLCLVHYQPARPGQKSVAGLWAVLSTMYYNNLLRPSSVFHTRIEFVYAISRPLQL